MRATACLKVALRRKPTNVVSFVEAVLVSWRPMAMQHATANTSTNNRAGRDFSARHMSFIDCDKMRVGKKGTSNCSKHKQKVSQRKGQNIHEKKSMLETAHYN